MRDRLLLVDIGNTSTTTGLAEGTRIADVRRFPRREGAPANIVRAVEAVRAVGVRGVALASVVPDLTAEWRKGLEEGLDVPVWELRPEASWSMGVDVPRPETVGPDRLANAIAAVARRGAPVMVADFGTALTFDVVAPDRGYIGGVIAPGIDLMFSYFHEKTALLPRLEFAPADRVVGRTTAEAMHAGAYFGYRGMVRELSARIRDELGPDTPLLATGGYAERVLGDFDEPVEILPHLTLEGLAIAWGDRDKKSKAYPPH